MVGVAAVLRAGRAHSHTRFPRTSRLLWTSRGAQRDIRSGEHARSRDSAGGTRRWRLGVVVASALLAAGTASARPAAAAPGQRVTLIGDSVMAALNFSAEARNVIASAYPM